MIAEPLSELSFHRLLVAVDGSENADLALSAAITAARRDHAALTLLAVAPDVRSAPWPGAQMSQAQLQEDADAYAQRVLREAVARIPEDIGVRSVFKRGRAGPVIVAEAADGDYDAVLLGARGVGRVGMLLGSVSNHVLHHATLAVFVAHAPAARPPRAGPRG